MPGRSRIFLLSPAFAGGKRAQMLLNGAPVDLAERLRGGGAPVGELFSFLSSLYFRGKMAYSTRFAAPPEGLPGSLVIVAGLGLIPLERLFHTGDLLAIAGIPVDPNDPRYREPLERDARMLREQAGPGCDAILLGSVATSKYVEPLAAIFGERLLFPGAFAGRGDMSRGGLLLRAAQNGSELEYVPALESPRHGARPPKLAR